MPPWASGDYLMLNAVSVGPACATRTAAALAGVLCGCGASAAVASEGGASFYIPGPTIPMAGFLPPPGVFFDNTTYFYQGKLPSGRNTALGGNIVAGVKVDAKVDFATAFWVYPARDPGRQSRVLAQLALRRTCRSRRRRPQWPGPPAPRRPAGR